MDPFGRNPPAKKSLGQNFLTDDNYVKKIISAVNPRPEDVIVEIGAGRGALTGRLVESGAIVLALEFDQDLIPGLQAEFGRFDNFRVIEQDALKTDFRELIEQSLKSKIENPNSVKLVANLPYYISTAILQKLIEQRNVFGEFTLMFQKEVVDRITARVGSGDRGFLTVLAEAYLTTEKLFDIPPQAFKPVPKVWSSIVRMTPHVDAGISDDDLFRNLVGNGFRFKRKTILNNLKNAGEPIGKPMEIHGGAANLLKLAGIDPRERGEAIPVEKWKALCNLLNPDYAIERKAKF